MKNWFVTKILQWLGRKLDGKKTYAGGVGKALVGFGTIITGIVGMLGIMFPDQGLPEMDIDNALALIGAGVYAISSGVSSIGVGHKIEKAGNAQI
jgi:hypothetical protein